ncbi:MAG TPA: DUF3048 domain-containing protein [Mycobacteriales bacterium]|nr:DUF3048 domain-containing protein [Mycobacteriales bacterium]
MTSQPRAAAARPRRSGRPSGHLAVVAALLGSTLLAACENPLQQLRAGAEGTQPLSTPSPSATPTPTPSVVAPVTPPVPTVDPLTGQAPVPTAPVVVLKVDNSPIARRFHRGLERAAVVYQELMEGGASRFAAVYTDGSAGEVGPIRSVRDSDLELLRPYGRVVVGSSGGNAGTVRTFRHHARAGRVIDASYDVLPEPYRLGERRVDARNFFTSPAALAKVRPHATRARDVGLRFGPLRLGTGTPATSMHTSLSPLSQVSAVYDPRGGRWSLKQDGRVMQGVAAANVIVQYVRIRGSGYVDVLGNPTPYTVTTGSGKAVVLRDGQRINATWRRLGHATGARYFDAHGRDVLLRPGSTWVLLVPIGRPLATS